MFVGGLFLSISPSKYNLWVVAEPTVLLTSSELQRIFWVASSRSFGGTIWVTYPVSSLLNESFLNPLDTKDFEPKLEFEFVIDWSEPLSDTKWFANPIAKVDTAWINASFDAFMW